MGLDTTHNAWHGPYSSFSTFRKRLAAKIGIDLDKMQGFTDDEIGIEWSTVNHGIVPLLNHSDCDGKLTTKECKKIAQGLTELMEQEEEDQWMRDKMEQFRDGCLLAVKKGEKIGFH